MAADMRAYGEFDFIVVGAGSAGCAAAARLSQAGHSVLLLEAGPPAGKFWISAPLGVGKLIADPEVNWCLQSEPEPALGGRRLYVPRGKVVGGSSSINGNVFVRGSRKDFDDWASGGCAGWSYSDVLPVFRRMENFERGGDAFRGTGGPLHVSDIAEKSEFLDQFLAAAEAAGIPLNPDTNHARHEGIGYSQTTTHRGRRFSSADAYLHRAPHVKVQTGARVRRIEQHNGEATGVVFETGGTAHKATVRGEVIICAGSVMSPALLEHSGIGDGKRLRELGLPVHLDLPGVGENLQEHFGLWMKWRIDGVVTLNQRLQGWRAWREGLEFALRRKGALSLPACPLNGYARTRPGLTACDVQLFLTLMSFENPEIRRLDRYPAATMTVVCLKPKSRGAIHIASPDPLHPPEIRFNAFSDPQDIETIVRGVGLGRRIMAQPVLSPYRPAEIFPGPQAAGDADLAELVMARGNTCYHMAGTCKMGTGPDAVVDACLRVHGIGRLRVADASVMPSIVSANTHATTVMIGERLADFVAASKTGHATAPH